MDIEGFTDLLNETRDFLAIALDESEINETIASMKLSLISRFLNNTDPIQRLDAMGNLHDIIMIVEQRSDEVEEYESLSFFEHVNSDFICKCIIENKMIETIFNENSYIDVAEKSGIVLEILSKQGYLSDELVEYVWKYIQKDVQNRRKVVLSAISQAASSSNNQFLLHSFSKIQRIPLKEYDLDIMHHVYDFTLSALKNRNSSGLSHHLNLDER